MKPKKTVEQVCNSTSDCVVTDLSKIIPAKERKPE